MKLFIYRGSQARSIKEAIDDGSIRYIGTFANETVGDVNTIEAVKLACIVTADCIDMDETLYFVEVDEARRL